MTIRRQIRILAVINGVGRLVIAVVILIAAGRGALCQQQFPDVPKGHWAYQAVLELRQKGILIGYPNGTFNGVMPKGQQKPKAAYDLSTPQSTWRSLIRAMANADEDGIRAILTDDFDESDTSPNLKFTHLPGGFAERKAIYLDRTPRWSRNWFGLFSRTMPEDREADAGVTDPNGPLPPSHMLLVRMKKIKVTWRITLIMVD